MDIQIGTGSRMLGDAAIFEANRKVKLVPSSPRSLVQAVLSDTPYARKRLHRHLFMPAVPYIYRFHIWEGSPHINTGGENSTSIYTSPSELGLDQT